MTRRFYVLKLNPEPWAIGDIQRGKTTAKMSPNLNLVAYQQAVKETLADEEMLPNTYRKFTFYFWRQQARYLDMEDRIRQRNQADATNMQKALEDALQGVLFKNDRDVLDIRSAIVAQGPEVSPGIVIKAERIFPEAYGKDLVKEIPSSYMSQILLPTSPRTTTSQRWEDSEDLF